MGAMFSRNQWLDKCKYAGCLIKRKMGTNIGFGLICSEFAGSALVYFCPTVNEQDEKSYVWVCWVTLNGLERKSPTKNNTKREPPAVCL